MAMSPKWPFVEMLIREDTVRAWQAFRDFLNGTPEDWQELLVRAHQNSWRLEEAAYERGFLAGLEGGRG